MARQKFQSKQRLKFPQDPCWMTEGYKKGDLVLQEETCGMISQMAYSKHRLLIHQDLAWTTIKEKSNLLSFRRNIVA